jgi:hypothetical protein
MTPTTTAVRAMATEISDRMSDGSRRLLVVAATIAAILGVWGGAADGSASLNGQPPAFRWLHPAPAPQGWKVARLPSGAATFAYPRAWRPIRTDPGTASVALISHGSGIRGYLNATPHQGTETLANWPSFRIRHLGEDDTRHVRLIASARGLTFRSGRGSCVIDSYRTSRARYREIACLVAGPRTSSVVVGAAPSKSWAQQAGTIERAISSLRTD